MNYCIHLHTLSNYDNSNIKLIFWILRFRILKKTVKVLLRYYAKYSNEKYTKHLLILQNQIILKCAVKIQRYFKINIYGSVSSVFFFLRVVEFIYILKCARKKMTFTRCSFYNITLYSDLISFIVNRQYYWFCNFVLNNLTEQLNCPKGFIESIQLIPIK